jgi:glycosyltransferase involved in cell wall biosynthesis
MKNPKVSVIIPVYNSEKTLSLCLESFIIQTYKNYELIVIDNNSTDRSKEIIKRYKNVKYVFEKKQGRSTARNRGIIEAKGEIIAMTDSDCIVPEDWVEKITEPIRQGGESAVVGGEAPAFNNFWAKNTQQANSDFVKKRMEKDGHINHIDTKNFAINSEIIKKNLFNVSLMAIEDYELYLRLKKIVKIRYLGELKVKHYHPANFSKVIKTNFERGHYAPIIFAMHKNENLKSETMMTSMYVKNILLYPFRIISSPLSKPFGLVIYNAIAASSWTLGNLYAKINSKNKSIF